MNGFGERIRQLRQKNNISQEDFAARMGVSRQSVSKWENDMAQPELDRLLKMSEIFGVSLDALVRGPADTPLESADMAGTVPAVHDAGGAAPPSPEAHSCETPAYSGKANAEQRTVSPDRLSPARRGWGIGLCCGGAVLFLLFTVLGGALTGLICGALLALPGVYCLTVRRHLGLWLGWTYFVLADWYLQIGTSGPRGYLLAVLRAPGILRDHSPVALVFSILINLFLLVMFVCTLASCRNWRLPKNRREILLTALPAAGWLGVLALSRLVMTAFPFARLAWVLVHPLLDWLAIALVTLLCGRLLALLRK